MAMLYASPNARGQIRSLGHFFNKHDTVAEKLGLAGASYELMSAIPAVVEYLGGSDAAAKWAASTKHEALLQKTLLAYLTSRDDVTIWGARSSEPAVRVPTVSFTVKGWNSQTLVETVEKGCNAGFRWGAFYSERLVKQVLGLGPDGVVRVSMVHYNTVEEVKDFITALDQVLERARKTSRPKL
jgi:selenocysteine lyase/cysteine desulfurase